jgi:hypothetical protein
MLERRNMVKIHGARVACIFPLGGKHGVIQDELRTAFEKFFHGDFLVGLGVDEGVRRLQLNERKLLSLFGDRVLQTGELFLFLEEREASLKMIMRRDDLGQVSCPTLDEGQMNAYVCGCHCGLCGSLD